MQAHWVTPHCLFLACLCLKGLLNLSTSLVSPLICTPLPHLGPHLTHPMVLQQHLLYILLYGLSCLSLTIIYEIYEGDAIIILIL